MNYYARAWLEEVTEFLRSNRPLDELTHGRFVWLARHAERESRRQARLDAEQICRVVDEAEKMTDKQRLMWEREWRERAQEEFDGELPMPALAEDIDADNSEAMHFMPQDLDEPAAPLGISVQELAEALDLAEGLDVEPECVCRYDQYAPGRRVRTAHCPEHGAGDCQEAVRLGHDPNFNPRGEPHDHNSLLRFLTGGA